MLEKPDLQEQWILSHVQEGYGLKAAQITFLPIGADENTAVYRLVTQDETVWFLKLRKGLFDPLTVVIPQFLLAQGVQCIIVPMPTKTGGHWLSLDDYTMILYPFIQGKNGYETTLSDSQMVAFGAVLKRIHTAQIPPELGRLLPREMYSARFREILKASLSMVEQATFEDPVAAKLAAFMKPRREEISHFVERAEELSRKVQERDLEFVLCHSDIHAGNILIGANDTFYIVDWDNPILAPKERDLMFIGGGVCAVWVGSHEASLFYQGYSPGGDPVEIDQTALAYFRFARIIEDMAIYSERLLGSTEGGDDREQSYQYFISSFLPGHEIELARQTDPG